MIALRLSAVRSVTSTVRLSARRFAHKTVVVDRELPRPPPPSKRRWLWTGIGVGAVVWGVGLGAALNHQRLSSSVVHGTLFTVRYDPQVMALIGDQIDYADSWPWISGSVNHLKGKIDIGFEVKGSTGERAKVHFVSKRVGGSKWVTSEFTVVRLSDNKSVDIGTSLTEAGEPLIEKQ
ncbi:cytochrome oxidase complex assembly protein 1-domain-containing protein [Pilaira anomala]|nr:cytochrome oxidase complex assembly protein 1-domain-containing protein [Pilaira anomala]